MEEHLVTFKHCQLTVSETVLRNEELYENITECGFRITSFRPLVIEKDSVTRQNILDLTNFFYEFQGPIENDDNFITINNKEETLDREICGSSKHDVVQSPIDIVKRSVIAEGTSVTSQGEVCHMTSQNGNKTDIEMASFDLDQKIEIPDVAQEVLHISAQLDEDARAMDGNVHQGQGHIQKTSVPNLQNTDTKNASLDVKDDKEGIFGHDVNGLQAKLADEGWIDSDSGYQKSVPTDFQENREKALGCTTNKEQNTNDYASMRYDKIHESHEQEDNADGEVGEFPDAEGKEMMSFDCPGMEGKSERDNLLKATNNIKSRPIPILHEHFESAAQAQISETTKLSTKETRSSYQPTLQTSDKGIKKNLQVRQLKTSPVVGQQMTYSESYQMGQIQLHVSNKPVTDMTADIVVTIGRIFNEMSGPSNYEVKNHLKVDAELPKCKEKFCFVDLTEPRDNSTRKICTVFSASAEIKEYFQHLDDVYHKERVLYDAKTLIITSHLLYSSAASSERGGKHSKEVGQFMIALHGWLLKISKEKPIQLTDITITADSEVVPVILRVLDSREEIEKIHQPVTAELGASAEAHKESSLISGASAQVSQECSVCRDRHASSVTPCCKIPICRVCKELTTADLCLTCRTAHGKTYGDQPDGHMTVTFSRDCASGFERFGSWKIEYSFPEGVQKIWHPSPGKIYNGTTRTAYVPANREGYHVLQLLRLAFMRRLVFTIGYSSTRQKDDVIIWTGIPHKTRLHGGSHGYPDPAYLISVTKELAGRLVKLENATEEEKLALAEFKKSLHFNE